MILFRFVECNVETERGFRCIDSKLQLLFVLSELNRLTVSFLAVVDNELKNNFNELTQLRVSLNVWNKVENNIFR